MYELRVFFKEVALTYVVEAKLLVKYELIPDIVWYVELAFEFVKYELIPAMVWYVELAFAIVKKSGKLLINAYELNWELNTYGLKVVARDEDVMYKLKVVANALLLT